MCEHTARDNRIARVRYLGEPLVYERDGPLAVNEDVAVGLGEHVG